MEFLGREPAGVISVACCTAAAASSTSFATLSSYGALTLWDVRLRRKNYLSLENPNKAVRTEASELRYLPDRHTAVALCGNTVQLFDTRKTLSVVSEYTHDKECVAFLKAPPAGSSSSALTTLIVDEDGGMFPYSFLDGSRPQSLEAYIFGQPCALPDGQSTFGYLDNYCSGLHCLDVPRGASADAPQRMLFAVGMDGNGALYSGASDGSAADEKLRRAFCIMETPEDRQKVQMVNPPLVNCTAAHQNRVAVGRADGTYSVYVVEGDAGEEGEEEGPQELLAAPGHAVNGLCYVDWFSPDVVMTTSLCGELTGWSVGTFLAAADEEADGGDEGELPEVVAALAHREVPGCQLATVNAGDRLGANCYVFGDNMGGVTMARVELA